MDQPSSQEIKSRVTRSIKEIRKSIKNARNLLNFDKKYERTMNYFDVPIICYRYLLDDLRVIAPSTKKNSQIFFDIENYLNKCEDSLQQNDYKHEKREGQQSDNEINDDLSPIINTIQKSQIKEVSPIYRLISKTNDQKNIMSTRIAIIKQNCEDYTSKISSIVTQILRNKNVFMFTYADRVERRAMRALLDLYFIADSLNREIKRLRTEDIDFNTAIDNDNDNDNNNNNNNNNNGQ